MVANAVADDRRLFYDSRTDLLLYSAEIDRVMKKVDEGELLFDEIWEKVYSAEQQNQKEKYEMDLKKEIKKLQRLRDQIKTWIGSAEVKDKGDLVEARKRIEQKMEQFKICEKETKTKTYSKEGLAREERLDPAEEAKLNTTGWLGEYIERLRQMVEEHDFELEKLVSGKGKKTNKAKIEELQNHVLNHKNHISKLEGVIRLVNNDRLDIDTVDAFQEDLDYYMDSYADEDYMSAYDMDFFYEPLGLDDLDVVNVDRLAQAAVKKDKDDTETLSSKGSSKDKKGKSKAVASVIPLTIGRARVSKADKKNAEKEAAKEEEKATPTKPTPSQPVPNGVPATVVRSPPAPATAAPGASMAAILKRESEQEKERQQKVCIYMMKLGKLRLQSHLCVLELDSSGATSKTSGTGTPATGGAVTPTRSSSATTNSTAATAASATRGFETTAARSSNAPATGGAASCKVASTASSRTKSADSSELADAASSK